MVESRNETYLRYLNGEEVTLPEKPLSRIEAYLAKIAGLEFPIPVKPLSRIETYLACLAGEDVELPGKPMSETEEYLAKLCGEEIVLPDRPCSRINELLAYAIEHGGWGEDDEDVTFEYVSQNYMSMKLKDYVDEWNLSTMGSSVFSDDPVLESAYMPAVTQVPSQCFCNCTALKTIIMPKARSMTGNPFNGCTALEELRLPACSSAPANYLNDGVLRELRILDIKPSNWNFDVSASGTKLQYIILRSINMPGSGVTPAFHADSPIAKGEGMVLVPEALLETYKETEGWSDYTIEAIEDHPDIAPTY